MKYGYDGELEPMLATEWKQVEPTTWEFTLRDDVEFQDGTPMDAEAVAAALAHLLEAETPARAFNADVVTAVEAIDEARCRSPPRSRTRWCRCGWPARTPGSSPEAYDGERSTSRAPAPVRSP